MAGAEKQQGVSSNFRRGPLLEFCDKVHGGSLDDYRAAGGFNGLALARSQGPAGVMLGLREGGLRERGCSGAPLFLTWQACASGEPPLLAADAVEPDAGSLNAMRLLATNPYMFIEGMLIASLTLGASQGSIILAGHLSHLASSVETAFAEFMEAPEVAGISFSLTVREGFAALAEVGNIPSLVHTLETWCLLPLMFSMGSQAFNAAGQGAQSGSKLLTVHKVGGRPSLLEVPFGIELSRVLEYAYGADELAAAKALALDEGLAGFLAPKDFGLALGPEEFTLAGVTSGFSSIRLLAPNQCVVYHTQHAMAQSYQRSVAPGPAKQGILHALRLVTQVSRGQGDESHIRALKDMAASFKAAGSPAAWSLGTSLEHFLSEWQDHLGPAGCPLGTFTHLDEAPCRFTCPAHIDIPGFMALAGAGKCPEALALIRRENPLAYICGLICPAPCEIACIKAELEGPLSIRAMKAYVAERTLAEVGCYPAPEVAPPTGKRAAVVGAGPAGLTAAYFLALAGHRVTIFEAAPQAGGTMFSGIPAYRLPREVIQTEVDAITCLGVELLTSQALGMDFTLESLREDGYEAVFLGIGAVKGYRLGLKGEDSFPLVTDALSFLDRVAAGDRTRPADKVVVVGGGNSAIDAARTCIRLGCSEVTVAYRRTQAEMPAHSHEVAEAREEGVIFRFLTIPEKLVGENGDLKGLMCLQAELGPPDESGRRRPVPMEGSEFMIEARAVIPAIGQATDTACLGAFQEDASFCRRTIITDPQTQQTSVPWIFAGGDAVLGPSTVVEAVACGKRAARQMDAYLKGEPLGPGLNLPHPSSGAESVPADPETRSRLTRAKLSLRPAAERKSDFEGIEKPYTPAEALGEAQRCLRCDICIGCGLCELVCNEVDVGAIRMQRTRGGRMVHADYLRPHSLCVGCGSCANACPTHAIKLVDQDGMRRTVLLGTVLQELPLLHCSCCGAEIPPEPYMAHVAAKDARLGKSEVDRTLCPACRREIQAQTMFL